MLVLSSFLASVGASATDMPSPSAPRRVPRELAMPVGKGFVLDSIPAGAEIDTLCYMLEPGLTACRANRPAGTWAVAYRWAMIDRGPHSGFYTVQQMLELDQRVHIPDTTQVALVLLKRLIPAGSLDSALVIARRLRPAECPKLLQANAREGMALKREQERIATH
jgi:hypothetical protein